MWSSWLLSIWHSLSLLCWVRYSMSLVIPDLTFTLNFFLLAIHAVVFDYPTVSDCLHYAPFLLNVYGRDCKQYSNAQCFGVIPSNGEVMKIYYAKNGVARDTATGVLVLLWMHRRGAVLSLEATILATSTYFSLHELRSTGMWRSYLLL